MKIAKLRKAQQMTQAELALLCDTSQQQVAKIEGGIVDPRLSTIRRLAGALHCGLPELFFTQAQFLEEVRAVYKKHRREIPSMTLWQLNDLCQKEADIPAYHPFWESLEIRADSVTFKEKKDV